MEERIRKLLKYEPKLESIIGKAIREDVGKGDITTELLFDDRQKAHGLILAEDRCIVCGTYIAQRVFEQLDPSANVRTEVKDGDEIQPGKIVAEITGRARRMLTGERLAMNFLQHLSGIATLTRKFVRAVEGTGAKIAATRKTTPLLRGLEKYAVETGGGFSHRMRLDDGILIKDNHLALFGNIREAVASTKAKAPRGKKVEVEVESLGELRDVLEAGADIILLDNMNIEKLREAVRIAKGKALLEASGGVHLENVREIAISGVDFISVGALTHSAPAVHFNMIVKKY
jgi:nicotinate-nucleotide pyrophosphorylase (carboxylating)